MFDGGFPPVFDLTTRGALRPYCSARCDSADAVLSSVAMPRHKCPRCGSRKNATLLYGLPALPTQAVERELELGRIAFAGCVVTGDDPRWHCTSCGALFGRPGETAPNFTIVDESDLAR